MTIVCKYLLHGIPTHNIAIHKPTYKKIIHIIPTQKDNNIIYHDFLPTPRRGSHVKSDKTQTQSSRYTP